MRVFEQDEEKFSKRSRLEPRVVSEWRRGRAQTVQHPQLPAVWSKLGQKRTQDSRVTKTWVFWRKWSRIQQTTASRASSGVRMTTRTCSNGSAPPTTCSLVQTGSKTDTGLQSYKILSVLKMRRNSQGTIASGAACDALCDNDEDMLEWSSPPVA